MVRTVRSSSLLTLVFASAMVGGCSRATTTSPAGGAQLRVSAADGKTAQAPATEAPHGSRRKALAGAPVFVDGAMKASLRFGELPSSVAPRSIKPGGATRYYRLSDYLAAIGVDVARVKSIHVRGNGYRISSIEQGELAAQPDRFVFEFLGTDEGAARVSWDTTGLRNKFRAHEIRDVLVYVDKPAPTVDAKRSCYVDGAKCNASVPHAEGEAAKGTRVYLDGKLVGHVKRRKLASDLVVGTTEDGVHRFALDKLLTSLGASPVGAKVVELVSGDDIVARASAADLRARKDEVTFTLPRHQSGRVLVSVPAAFQSTEATPEVRDAEVTAVLVYGNTAPRNRAISTISPITSETPNSDAIVPGEDS